MRASHPPADPAMARIHPEGWRQLPANGALAREIETLATLAEALPDDYSVFHGVHWTRVERGHALFGEIDFAVVGPGGALLLIEQKSGFLDETPDGLVKRYRRGTKNVASQLARTADKLRTRLAALPGGVPPLDILLYCPDYTVRSPGSAGIDPARIVDATRREQLGAIVASLARAEGHAHTDIAALHRFLADELELVADASALVGRAERLYTRLAGGLAQWARAIEMSPHRLRVTGTAGSGKTQLALAVLADAHAAGRRALYVCYNRPLADHIALVAPPGPEVATYHQLCDRVLREAGQSPDFTRPDAFERLEAGFQAWTPDERWRFDELIVDEGQDFREDWSASLLRLLRDDGRAWWLEDPLQNLYGRPEVALPGWVRLRSARNYRSPADILAVLDRVLAPDERTTSSSPITESNPEFFVWRDRAGLIDQTKKAITRAIGLGFRRDMIAIVSFRGREHSLLAPYDRLGPHRLRAFTGGYDLLGNPVYSEGELTIDSVYRFKGQAAPCVIFSEIDFEALDTLAVRKLFVGATRASMKLILVLSERAAARLGGSEPG